MSKMYRYEDWRHPRYYQFERRSGLPRDAFKPAPFWHRVSWRQAAIGAVAWITVATITVSLVAWVCTR